MNEVLNPKKVEEIFIACIFKEGEKTSTGTLVGTGVLVEGYTRDALLDYHSLEYHKKEIIAMLAELPNEFQKSKGGGCSFLQSGIDKNGNQWTGLHMIMEHLLLLGLAIGKIQFVLPKEKWRFFAGGIPSYMVIDDEIQNETNPQTLYVITQGDLNPELIKLALGINDVQKVREALLIGIPKVIDRLEEYIENQGETFSKATFDKKELVAILQELKSGKEVVVSGIYISAS